MLRFMEGNPKWDVTNGLASIEDFLGDGAAFVVSIDGAPAVVIAIEKVDWANGKELVIRVAHQVDGCGRATEQVLPKIESDFGYDCQSVLVVTRRPGLVKKLKKQAYVETGRMMRKRL